MAESNENEPVIAEAYIAVNEDGDWAVGQDEEEASDRLREEHGGYQARVAQLSIDITALVPQPIEVSATLPKGEDGSYSLEIKQS